MAIIVKHKEGTRANIDLEDYEVGSLLITSDTNEMFFDSLMVNNKRIRIGDPANLSTGDLDTMITSGKWLTRNGGSLTNLPVQQLGLLEVTNADDYVIQRYTAKTGTIYLRVGTISGNTTTWGSWRTI